jgi:hypothetical protein
MRAVVSILERCVVAFRIVVEGEVEWVTGAANYRSIKMDYKMFRAYLLDMTFAEPIRETLQQPMLRLTSWA